MTNRYKSDSAVPGVEIIHTQRDLQTGIDYHLVGKRNTGGCNGRWVSTLDIELRILIRERFNRRRKHEAFAVMSMEILAKKRNDDMMLMIQRSKQAELDAKLKSSTACVVEVKTKSEHEQVLQMKDLSDVSKAVNTFDITKKPKADQVSQLNDPKPVAEAFLKEYTLELLKLHRKHGSVQIPSRKLLKIKTLREHAFGTAMKPFGYIIPIEKIKELLLTAEVDAKNRFAIEQRPSTSVSALLSVDASVNAPSRNGQKVSGSLAKSTPFLPRSHQSQEQYAVCHNGVQSQTSLDESAVTTNRVMDYVAPHERVNAIVSKHKIVVSHLVQRHGSMLSETILEPYRQMCASKLSACIEQAGINLSKSQMSAAIIEAENEVLFEQVKRTRNVYPFDRLTAPSQHSSTTPPISSNASMSLSYHQIHQQQEQRQQQQKQQQQHYQPQILNQPRAEKQQRQQTILQQQHQHNQWQPDYQPRILNQSEWQEQKRQGTILQQQQQPWQPDSQPRKQNQPMAHEHQRQQTLLQQQQKPWQPDYQPRIQNQPRATKYERQKNIFVQDHATSQRPAHSQIISNQANAQHLLSPPQQLQSFEQQSSHIKSYQQPGPSFQPQSPFLQSQGQSFPPSNIIRGTQIPQNNPAMYSSGNSSQGILQSQYQPTRPQVLKISNMESSSNYFAQNQHEIDQVLFQSEGRTAQPLEQNSSINVSGSHGLDQQGRLLLQAQQYQQQRAQFNPNDPSVNNRNTF